MNTMIMQPGSDTSVKLSYLTLASTLIIVTSYNFINSLNSVTEKLLAIGISSSLLASIFIIVKVEQIIERLYVKRDLTKKQYIRTAKEAPLRKFYSTIISQTILAFSFLILTLASIFSPFRDIPDGILFDLLKPFELNLFLALIFGTIMFFLIYRIKQQYGEYKPRLQRATVYYLLIKDKNVHSQKNAHLSFIDEYGSALTLNDWSTEESKFNKLKRDYYSLFIDGLNNMNAFIRALDLPHRKYDNLKYFFDIGTKQNSLMNSNYIKNTLNVSKILGIKFFSDLNTNIHLKLVKIQTNVEKLHKDIHMTAKKILNEDYDEFSFGQLNGIQQESLGENLRNMLLDPKKDHKLYRIYHSISEDTVIYINLLNEFIEEFKEIATDLNEREEKIIQFLSTATPLNEKIEN